MGNPRGCEWSRLDISMQAFLSIISVPCIDRPGMSSSTGGTMCLLVLQALDAIRCSVPAPDREDGIFHILPKLCALILIVGSFVGLALSCSACADASPCCEATNITHPLHLTPTPSFFTRIVCRFRLYVNLSCPFFIV